LIKTACKRKWEGQYASESDKTCGKETRSQKACCKKTCCKKEITEKLISKSPGSPGLFLCALY
jgi:hypothetical protein